MRDAKILTIGSRTMKDWNDWLARSKITFNEWAFGTDIECEVDEIKAQYELHLRADYRGGRCQAFKTGLFHEVHHIDRHSMYPAVMCQPYIPHGALLDEKPNFRHTEIIWPCGFYYLKDEHHPCLNFQRKTDCLHYSMKGDLDVGEFADSFRLDGSMGFWKDEYDMMLKHYDVDDEWLYVTRYIGMKENHRLKDYMTMLYEGKRNNTGSKKLNFKLRLNSLYGKY